MPETALQQEAEGGRIGFELFDVKRGRVHAGEEFGQVGGVVDFEADQGRPGFAVVFLGVFEQDDVIAFAEDFVEEVAERPGFLGEGDEEVVAEAFVDERAFHDVVVARYVVVSAGDDAGDGAVGQIGEEAGDRGAREGPGWFGDDSFYLVQVQHLAADGAFWDGDDVVYQVTRNLEGEIAHPGDGGAIGETVDFGEGDGFASGQCCGHGGGAFGFDADDADLGVELPEPDRGAGEEAAAAHGNHDGSGPFGGLLEDFLDDGALTSDGTCRVEGVDVRGAHLGGIGLGCRGRLIEGGPADDLLDPWTANILDAGPLLPRRRRR